MPIITDILNCYVTKTEKLYQSTQEGFMYAEKLVYAHRDDLVCKIMTSAVACARRMRYSEIVYDGAIDHDDYDYDDNDPPTSRSRSPSRSRSRSRLRLPSRSRSP